MKQIKTEEKNNNFAKIWGYSLISGFIELLTIILVNMFLFLVTLYYDSKSLPYMLIFFGISCLFRIFWRKK